MKKEKLINFKKNEDFQKDLQAGELKETSIIFVDDKKKIYTHNTEFDGNIPDWNAEDGEAGYIKNKPDLSNLGSSDCPFEKSGEGYRMIGNTTTEIGKNSLALNKSINCSGSNSVAEGVSTKATATGSHAEGTFSEATGSASHAEGSSYAKESYAHSEGCMTNAEGSCSHSEGQGTTASGKYSHAEGNASKAIGETSHAEGQATNASGDYSHSEGARTKAVGYISHAEGQTTTANGNYSHTEGNETIAENECEHASGTFNISTKTTTKFGDEGNTLFSIGNGREINRHNAFEIRQNGDIYIVDFNDTTTSFYYRKPMLKLQDLLANIGSGSSIEVVQTTGDSTTSVMSQKAVSDTFVPNNKLNEELDKKFNKVDFPFILKSGNIYYDGGGAFGREVTVGSYGFASGWGTQAGEYCHTEGYGSIASGEWTHAEGIRANANGNGSHAEGSDCTANGTSSHVEGTRTTAENESEHACGQWNISTKGDDDNNTWTGSEKQTLFSVGNGYSWNNHNAIEIKQNGDIYISNTNAEGEYYQKPMIKLQDALQNGVGGSSIEVVQTTGNSTTSVMSQKAVTDALFKYKVVSQEEYNSISKDPDTFYFIKEEE